VSSQGIFARLFSRRAAAMLGRNTVVSSMAFLISIGLLWALVEFLDTDEVLAATIGFLTANSVHYILGRTWIFRGTDRTLAMGYLYFLFSSGIGLFVTVTLYAAMLRYTPINYLLARVLVSVFAGLAMFAFNATINFRRL
jgi:putative flippase GtrA